MRSGAMSLFSLFVVWIAVIIMLIFGIAIALDNQDKEVRVDFIEVDILESVTNAFLQYESEDLGSASDMISVYVVSGDQVYKQGLESALKDFFKDRRVDILIEGDFITNGVAARDFDEFKLVDRQIYGPDGIVRIVRFRYYEK